jgi:acetylglutamate kinase
VTAARPLVVKLGGELLEDGSVLSSTVSTLRRIASRPNPLVVVHGGGTAIDAALGIAGIQKRQIDGLRVTDEATLNVVVAVLAGSVNTRLVAALVAAGVQAVGLTAADAECIACEPAPPHHAVDGREVNLGFVGVPGGAGSVRLLEVLLAEGFVPVMACIGARADGQLLNVNADTLSGDVAARLGAWRLIIAGTTPGVLTSDGATAPLLDPPAIARLVGDRTATAGMVAKLQACDRALAAGVDDVVIVDGRDDEAFEYAATGGAPSNATRLIRSMVLA